MKQHVKHSLLFLLLTLSFLQLRAQDSTIHVYIVEDTVRMGKQVCMPVYVDNFVNIDAFQLSFNFDPYLLDFDSVANLNTDIGLTEGFFGLQETHLGIVRITFFDALMSHTVPDSSTLFELCFTAYGTPDELCPVNISNFPLPIEFISNLQNATNFSTRSAELDILPSDTLTGLVNSCHNVFPDTTGSLSISAYGGTPPYFVLWQHTFNANFSGGFSLNDEGDVQEIENLIEGRYRISITDNDGTRFRDSINLVRANTLNYVSTIEHPICDNTFEGSIEIDSLQGGIVPSQFKWSDGELFSRNRSGLTTGEYYLTITQPLGCRIIDTFTLSANSIIPAIDVANESCLDTADGGFTLSLMGGNPIDTLGYEIYYNNDTTFGFSLADTGLAIGQYNVLVRDSLGCEKEIDFEVRSGVSFGVDSLSLSPVRCFGDSTASIYLRPKNLSGDEVLPYTFSWTGTDSAVVDSQSIYLPNLPRGSYSIRVTNDAAPGCFWDTSFVFGHPPFLNVLTSNVVPASCDPGMDGEATISIFGGTPDGDGKYLILWPNGQDSTTATMLSADTITVRVIDAEGCQATHDVIVPSTPPPTLIGSSIRDIRCDSMPRGSILTIFSSPFGLESYAWSTGDSTSNIEDIRPGAYTCTVTDRNGCSAVFDFEAKVPNGPEITDFMIDNIQCHGDSNGRLEVSYIEGDNIIAGVSWNGFPGRDSLTNLPPGGYTGIVFDAAGCTDTVATTLLDPTPISISHTIIDDVDGQGIGSITSTPTGGWSPYQYSWIPDSLPNDSIVSNLVMGAYVLTVEDAQGCQKVDTVLVDEVSATVNISSKSAWTLFPNPTSSELTISPPHHIIEGQLDISVYDAQGKKMLSKQVNTFPATIDVNILPSGSYHLKVSSTALSLVDLHFIKI